MTYILILCEDRGKQLLYIKNNFIVKSFYCYTFFSWV